MAPDEPRTFLDVAEGGVKKVGLTLLIGGSLVVLALLVLPRAPGAASEAGAGDAALHLLRVRVDGVEELGPARRVRAGELLRLSADVPFAGQVQVVEVGAPGGLARLWPAGEPTSSHVSAGRRVTLADVETAGAAAGERTWTLVVCGPGGAPADCQVDGGTLACPESCAAAAARFEIRGP